jgi:glutathione S-transferase
MITLYHASPTRSHLVRFCLEELGLPHELITLDLARGEHKAPKYLALHPHGQLPVLVDGGAVLRECGAIAVHLADKVPERGLAAPVATKDRGAYLQWCFYAMTTELPAIGKIALHTLFLPPEARSAQVAEDGRREWADVARVLSDAVRGRAWLLGDKFSTADVLVGGALWLAAFIGVLDAHPELRAYFGRVRERPAFARAFADAPPLQARSSS